MDREGMVCFLGEQSSGLIGGALQSMNNVVIMGSRIKI